MCALAAWGGRKSTCVTLFVLPRRFGPGDVDEEAGGDPWVGFVSEALVGDQIGTDPEEFVMRIDF